MFLHEIIKINTNQLISDATHHKPGCKPNVLDLVITKNPEIISYFLDKYSLALETRVPNVNMRCENINRVLSACVAHRMVFAVYRQRNMN